jgi:hypothetical protein
MQLPNDGFQLTPQAAPLASRGASSCPGTGAVECGMAHQGYDLQLTRHAERGWRATFFPVGIAHSVVGGSAWEPTPWAAVQRAAWETLTKEDGR